MAGEDLGLLLGEGRENRLAPGFLAGSRAGGAQTAAAAQVPGTVLNAAFGITQNRHPERLKQRVTAQSVENVVRMDAGLLVNLQQGRPLGIASSSRRSCRHWEVQTGGGAALLKRRAAPPRWQITIPGVIREVPSWCLGQQLLVVARSTLA